MSRPRPGSSNRCLTPVGVLARAAFAGLIGTAAMDLAQYLRYRAGGGTDSLGHFEFSSVTGWETAPAPAQVAKRLVEGLLQTGLPDAKAGVANNVMHWGYGTGWATAFGLLAGSTESVRLWWGPLFGTTVFLADYVVLPPTGLYQPIRKNDAKSLARDWFDHALYGATTGAVLRVLLKR